MMIYYVLVSIAAVFILLVLIPVKIKISDTPYPTLYICWLSLRFHAFKTEETVQTSLTFCGVSISPGGKKAAPSAKKKKGSSSPKKSKKIGFAEIKKIALSPEIRPIIYRLFRFVLRIFKGCKITLLKWDIGLEDYYLQGIITGLAYAVPQSKRISICCNFQEQNAVDFRLNFYIWKFIVAIVSLLLFFPYLKMYKLIKLIK